VKPVVKNFLSVTQKQIPAAFALKNALVFGGENFKEFVEPSEQVARLKSFAQTVVEPTCGVLLRSPELSVTKAATLNIARNIPKSTNPPAQAQKRESDCLKNAKAPAIPCMGATAPSIPTGKAASVLAGEMAGARSGPSSANGIATTVLCAVPQLTWKSTISFPGAKPRSTILITSSRYAGNITVMPIVIENQYLVIN
jgi:hypothetical protein